MRKVITIDGLAGSGKSSIAKELSKKTQFKHLNSGILYRAIAYIALKNKFDFKDINQEKLAQLLSSSKIETLTDGISSSVLINGTNPGNDLFLKEVTEASSVLSAEKLVREHLVQLQRNAFKDHNMIAEGRDMGTVIFPDAQAKFFIETDIKERAKRRLAQIDNNIVPANQASLVEKIEQEILERDKRDQKRSLSPAIPAPDAIIIDNSAQTLTQVVKIIYDLLLKQGLVSS